MDEPDEAVKRIADKLGVYVVGAEMKGFGLFNSDNNIILYNEKLKPVTRRMIILHELGHALSYKRIGDKEDILNNIKHEYEANRFMVRYEVESYISEVGIDNFVIEHFMEKYGFPKDFKPFVKRVIKQALKIK